MEDLGRLRAVVTVAVTAAVLGLVVLDAVDDMLGASQWAGCPPELVAILGSIVGGLYAPDVVRAIRRKNGNGGSKEGDGGGAVPAG